MNERVRISNPDIKTRKQFKIIVPGEDKIIECIAKDF